MDEADPPAPTPPLAPPPGRARRLMVAIERFASDNPLLRVLRSLRELVLLLLWLLFGILPTGKTSLHVRYRLLNLQPPAAAKPFLDSSQTLDPHSAARVAAAALTSPQLLRVELRNQTSSTISHVDLTIRGAVLVGAVAADSDSRLDPGAADFQLRERTISFPHLREIAPGAWVTVLVWGQFAPQVYFFEGGPVGVSSDAAATQINEEGAASGVGLFIADNISWLTILLATGLLLAGLRRLRRS
jgi:hypothetical protein